MIFHRKDASMGRPPKKTALPSTAARGSKPPIRRLDFPITPDMGYRLLHFVRHGQYTDEQGPDFGHLTARGIRQTEYLARQLGKLAFDQVHSSDLPRALQTAAIISDKLAAGPVKVTRALREVLPAGVMGMRVSRKTITQARTQVDTLFRTLLRPSRQPRHEVVVCHGNLIRTILCRLTGAPPKGFVNYLFHHTGVMRVVVFPNGIRVLSVNDVHHLPATLRTM